MHCIPASVRHIFSQKFLASFPANVFLQRHTVNTLFLPGNDIGLIHGKLYVTFFPFATVSGKSWYTCRDVSAINQQIQTCKRHQYQFRKPNAPNRNASIDQRNTIKCGQSSTPVQIRKTAHVYPLSLLYAVGLSTSDRKKFAASCGRVSIPCLCVEHNTVFCHIRKTLHRSGIT